MSVNVSENYKRIRDIVLDTTVKAGRKEEEVELIAVTKYVDLDRIEQAINAGAKSVGENKVQEYLKKAAFFREHNINADIIGQLQTNKVKYITGEVRYIQSVDRLPLANEINKHACAKNLVQNVLVEVNIGNEKNKGGIAQEDLYELLCEISQLKGISVKGLMCIPPAVSEKEARAYFAKMKKIFDDIASKKIDNIQMKQLSMGMSSDFVAAIKEGATMVRVGSAIFGARNYN